MGHHVGHHNAISDALWGLRDADRMELRKCRVLEMLAHLKTCSWSPSRFLAKCVVLDLTVPRIDHWHHLHQECYCWLLAVGNQCPGHALLTNYRRRPLRKWLLVEKTNCCTSSRQTCFCSWKRWFRNVLQFLFVVCGKTQFTFIFMVLNVYLLSVWWLMFSDWWKVVVDWLLTPFPSLESQHQ